MEQKKKHLHTGHRQRMKNKAVDIGIESWPYHEILELLLMFSIPQKDVNPLAHELIDTFGSFGGVLDAGYEQLRKVKGIGDGTALFLSLIPDIFAKYRASKNTGSVNMTTAYQSVKYFRETDRIKSNETFYIFCLDGKNDLVKVVKVDSDFPSSVSISISWFARQILAKNTKSIVIMHSHPNGDSNPTDADVQATKKLITTVKALGLDISDHIIVTESTFFSFADSGLLEGLKNELIVKGYSVMGDAAKLKEEE